MFEQRLEFSKLGRARFLSHLDTMRVFQRALTRAGVPVMYSQGFNPHMKMSIAFPLPLGVESLCEIIDLRLENPVNGLVEKLNAALPEGFEILRTLPLFAVDSISHIRYELEFSQAFENIFDGRPLVVQKKTKHGFDDLDIYPHVENVVISSECEHGLQIDLSVKAPQISPSHVLSAIRIFYPEIEMTHARRLLLISNTANA